MFVSRMLELFAVFALSFFFAYLNIAWVLWVVVSTALILFSVDPETEMREKMTGDVWGNWATR